MNAVETYGLRRYFGDVRALDGLDLTVKRGEIFALLGSNGAGKSTLINVLTCALCPTSGGARVMGYDLTEAAKVRSVISVCPQKTAVALRLTVRENLMFMCRIYGMNRSEARARTEELIAEFSLGEVAERSANKLSGGYARKLSAAMSLTRRPAVLFLDEPTAGLDVMARRELWNAVMRVKGDTTVVLITHYLEEAETFADRVGIMARGKLLAVGAPTEISAAAGAVSFEEAFIRTVGGA